MVSVFRYDELGIVAGLSQLAASVRSFLPAFAFDASELSAGLLKIDPASAGVVLAGGLEREQEQEPFG